MGEMVTLEHVEKYFSIGGGFLKKNARSVKAVDDVSFTIQEEKLSGSSENPEAERPRWPVHFFASRS